MTYGQTAEGQDGLNCSSGQKSKRDKKKKLIKDIALQRPIFKDKGEATEGTGTQIQEEQRCLGPQARVKSSDFLLSLQGRIYIGFTFTKDCCWLSGHGL